MSDAWLTPKRVAEWLQLDNVDAPLGPREESARLAAAGYVRQVRPDLFTDDGGGPGETAIVAALIATKRLMARTSGTGFPEFGPAVALLELDPDVSALLGLGHHAPPRVG